MKGTGNKPSSIHAGISVKVDIEGKKYIATTELIGGRYAPAIVTSIYNEGEVVASYEADSGYDSTSMSLVQLEELMHEHHDASLGSFRSEKKKEAMGPSHYINAIQSLIRRRKLDDACAVMAEATERFPQNPFVLSFSGLLKAETRKDYKRGISDCREAITRVKRVVACDVELVYPLLFLNLGRAYMASGDRKNAVAVFSRALYITGGNQEIAAEMRKLGVRRGPMVPFLARSNPINKYLGMLVQPGVAARRA